MARFRTPASRMAALNRAAEKFHVRDNGDNTADIIGSRGVPLTLQTCGAVVLNVKVDGKQTAVSGQQFSHFVNKGTDPNENGQVIRIKNGDPTNLHPDNLAQEVEAGSVTGRCGYSSSQTGVIGVYPTESGKYSAVVTHNGKRLRAGTFDTIEEATEARLNKIIDLNTETFE